MEAWFEAHPSNVTKFPDMLAWYLRHGYVFNTHEFFVMGRPIALQQTREQTDAVIDALTIWEPGAANCWYFSALAGNLTRVWHLLPFDLKWMAYHRMVRGKAKLYVRPLAPFRRRAMLLASSNN